MDALVVSLVGLGGLYILSNDEKETFKNRDKSIPQTYPTKTTTIRPQEKDYINKYKDPNQTTDKIFKNIKNYSPLMGQDIKSMNGNTIAESDFVHNNMEPFFGSKLTGFNITSKSQTTLDHYTGSGSQHVSKTECGPLFKPQENIHWAHGMPNNSDFYQNHQYISSVQNNNKPWVEKQVGPGLGTGNNGITGSGGFNSGQEARQNWMPKTVDQLRTENNPKTVGLLNGLEGPAESKIVNRGIHGRIEKNRPDTDFAWGKDRWFTTTGQEIAPTTRSKHELNHVNRPETNAEHFGVSGSSSQQAQTAPENYKSLAAKPHCYKETLGGAHAPEQNNISKNDYGLDSYKFRPNNRNTTATSMGFGGAGSLVEAIVSPILDVIKPSRKENVLGNLRESGNVQGQMATYNINPGDKPKTTIKEMTLNTNPHINVQRQQRGIGSYDVYSGNPIANQRDTTNTSNFGNANSIHQKPSQIDKYLKQRNNNNKSTISHTPIGNNNIFTGNISAEFCTNRDQCSTRNLAPNSLISSIPNTQTYGKQNSSAHFERNSVHELDPDLLNAFKSNPYTQSLKSF